MDKKLHIQLNESKSDHFNFTNRRLEHIPDTINNQKVPYANTAKYMGMTLDSKLRLKAHVKKKREKMVLRCKRMYWLIGRNSSLSLHNKLFIQTNPETHLDLRCPTVGLHQTK